MPPIVARRVAEELVSPASLGLSLLSCTTLASVPRGTLHFTGIFDLPAFGACVTHGSRNAYQE